VAADGTSCGELTAPPGQECVIRIIYTYTTTNVGGNAMDTQLQRSHNGNTVVLTQQVIDANPLPLATGDTTLTTKKEEDLNVCIDSAYKTTIRVEYETMDVIGVPCSDEDEIKFVIENT
jgi:hypothetical protein